MPSSFTLRPATAADQPVINKIVRDAGINPMNLDWPRFIVAVADDTNPVGAGLDTTSNQPVHQPDPPLREIVIGVGQIKPHSDVSRELASIAVIPAWRGRGVARAIIQTLLAGETGDIYLFCRDGLESFYTRFGFYTVAKAGLPPVMARIHRFGNLMASVGSRLTGEKIRILAMKREG